MSLKLSGLLSNLCLGSFGYHRGGFESLPGETWLKMYVATMATGLMVVAKEIDKNCKPRLICERLWVTALSYLVKKEIRQGKHLKKYTSIYGQEGTSLCYVQSQIWFWTRPWGKGWTTNVLVYRRAGLTGDEDTPRLYFWQILEMDENSPKSTDIRICARQISRHRRRISVDFYLKIYVEKFEKLPKP